MKCTYGINFEKYCDLCASGYTENVIDRTLYILVRDFETPIGKFEKGISYLPHIWATFLGLQNGKSFLDLYNDQEKSFRLWFEKKGDI